MARRRLSLRGLLLLVVALVALFLLLQMNRWLPGGWPGGGGTGGFRTEPVDSGEDPTRVRPAADLRIEWPPREGIRIEVRTAEGARASNVGLAAGEAGPPQVLKDGATTLPWGPPVRQGFRVQGGGRDLVHRGGLDVPARDWVVFLPSATGSGAAKTPPGPRTLKARLVDPAGEALGPARVSRLRGGLRTPVPVAKDGTFEASVPATELETTAFEVRVDGRPVVVARAEGLASEVAVPAGRTLRVRVSDPSGGRPDGASATARYVATGPAGGTEEPIEASVTAEAGDDGVASLAVPASGSVEVLAEGLRHAPAARRLVAADGSDVVEMVLAPGTAVPVRVLLEDGRPAAGAEVVGHADVEGVRVVRAAIAGRDGIANVGPFAEGPVEVYAKAPGHAWAATTATASSAMGTTEVRLAAGRDLTIVVETPDGAPVDGARVRLTPEEGGAPDVTPPGAPPLETNARGVLVARDLPDRPFTARLSAPGFHAERLPGLRPGPTTWFATLVPE